MTCHTVCYSGAPDLLDQRVQAICTPYNFLKTLIKSARRNHDSVLSSLTPRSETQTNMASRVGPRSVKDATRFTSTIPHAASKGPGAAGPAARAARSQLQSRIPGETPEQRVTRLRAAHLAAQQAQITRTDRFVDASRRFFDVAHRWTINGIIIFTGTADST